MFYLADMQQQSYSPLRDTVSLVARVKGFAEVIQDLFCFQMRALSAGDEGTPIWMAEQVWTDKCTGTGESISPGQKVYATLASGYQSVTANPVGTIGTDYYFCGFAIAASDEEDEQVLIKFLGDEYNHADRAA